MISKILITISLLLLSQPVENQKIDFPNPLIISISSNYPRIGTWIQIPKGSKTITFNVKAENTETVLFWLIPTGTQTWTERELIGYDIKETEGNSNFSFTWIIDRPFLHDHLQIQALGNGISNNIINLEMH